MTRWRLVGLGLLVALGACDPAVDCAALDVAACGAEPACTVISGREITTPGDTDPCLEAPTPLACMPVDQGCDDALTNAADPADPGTCFLFTNGCTPPGWGACDSDPGQPEDAC